MNRLPAEQGSPSAARWAGGPQPNEPLPEPARRRLALAFERAGEVEALMAAALAALGLDAAPADAERAVDPRAANWRGQLEALREDLAAPLRRRLQDLCATVCDHGSCSCQAGRSASA